MLCSCLNAKWDHNFEQPLVVRVKAVKKGQHLRTSVLRKSSTLLPDHRLRFVVCLLVQLPCVLYMRVCAFTSADIYIYRYTGACRHVMCIISYASRGGGWGGGARGHGGVGGVGECTVLTRPLPESSSMRSMRRRISGRGWWMVMMTVTPADAKADRMSTTLDALLLSSPATQNRSYSSGKSRVPHKENTKTTQDKLHRKDKV